MDISANVTVPDYIYRFYSDASGCILGHSPEDVMADALIAYALMLSRDLPRPPSPAPENER